METSLSAANHTVLHSQSDRCALLSIETGANYAVLQAQNDR